MLISHPLIVGGPEFDMMRYIAQLHDRMSQPQQLVRNEWYYAPQELHDRFRAFAYELFRNVIERHPAARFIAEKSPANIDGAAQILKLFPDAWYLNVTRDGRDVVASYKQVYVRLKEQMGPRAARWKHEYSLRTVSSQWNRNIVEYLNLRQNAAIAPRVLNLRYEDLVTQPDATIAPVLQALGLELNERMLQPEKVDAKHTGQATNIDGVWYTEKQFEQPISDRAVGNWKRQLSSLEQLRATVLMAPSLQRMGYDVQGMGQFLSRTLRSLRRR